MELKVVKRKLSEVDIKPKIKWDFLIDAIDKLTDPEDCMTINLGKDHEEARAISKRMQAVIYGHKPKTYQTNLITNDKFEMVFVISLR